MRQEPYSRQQKHPCVCALVYQNLSDRINHGMVFIVECSTKYRLREIYKA